MKLRDFAVRVLWTLRWIRAGVKPSNAWYAAGLLVRQMRDAGFRRLA